MSVNVNETNPIVPPPGPCAMVIFGATGDLTKRLLMPAVYNLAAAGLLPEKFAVVGVAIESMSAEQFAEKLKADVKETAGREIDDGVWSRAFDGRLFYTSGDFGDAATFQQLGALLEQIERDLGTAGNRLFYLATPPSLFAPIIGQIAGAGLTSEDDSSSSWRRVIIEKPFGHDLDSARELNRDITSKLRERQIYRIDHYLGKETVQNILVFRFANGIFEPIWNRRYIDHVQITVAETVGVEHRGAYYDHAGAVRDMVPNHLLQILSLVAMESPGSFEADAVRDEKAKLLKAIRPLDERDVLSAAVRGQYDAGQVAGQPVTAYRQSPNVAADSNIETFAAFKVAIDNWRWADVPFYVRTGKALPQRVSEVAIQFKRAPFMPFRETAVEHMQPNSLIIRIQPDEGISLSFEAKRPGIAVQTETVKMDFNYADYFRQTPFIGYETLLYDCMNGDQTLFQRADFVEAGWRAITPILDVWSNLPARKFPNYSAGSWGPKEADELLAKDGRHWRNPSG